jgi:hypothetical protein
VPTIFDTLRAAAEGFSCSHTRTTVHPAAASAESCRRSRSKLAASLSAHHSRLVFGIVPCSEHPCQKHPSTNTTTRARVKTMSGRVRGTPAIGCCTLNRRPSRWSADRNANSAGVSRRGVACILRRTAAELAGGVGLAISDPL